MVFFNLIPALILIIIIGVIIAVIVSWRRREDIEGDADEGIGTVRRVYFYGVAFVSILIAANGIVFAARYVLDELFGPPALLRDASQLALGLALAVIWTPAWAWHWYRVQRYASEEPAEYRAILRQLYVYALLAVAAALAVQGLVDILRWLFGARSFSGYALAAFAVWSLIWAMHWAIATDDSRRVGETTTLRRLYIYFASAFSLAMLSIGLGYVLYIVLREAYDGLFSPPLLVRGQDLLWGDSAKNALAVAIVGGIVWPWHWLYAARTDTDSLLRQFYLYVLAILSGVIATLVAAGLLIGGTLGWFIGTPEETSAAAHFRFLPGAIAILPVAIGLWTYHWWVVQSEHAAAGQLRIARRVYAYIMSGVGLAALVGAIVILVATIIELAAVSARDVFVGEDWWRDQIVAVITLGLLGAPVWGYHWFSMQREVMRAGAEERASRARAVMVFGVLCVGGLAFLGSVSFLFFKLLDVVLGDAPSADLLRDIKWALGVLAAAIIFVPYYLFVLLEDRRAGAERPAAREAVTKPVTVLIGEDGRAFVSDLEGVLGKRVRVLRRADADAGVPELSPDDLERLRVRVQEAAGTAVLLVVESGQVQVFSYR